MSLSAIARSANLRCGAARAGLQNERHVKSINHRDDLSLPSLPGPTATTASLPPHDVHVNRYKVFSTVSSEQNLEILSEIRLMPVGLQNIELHTICIVYLTLLF